MLDFGAPCALTGGRQEVLLTALATLLLAGSLGAAPLVVIEHAPPDARSGALEARMVSTAGRKVIEPAAFVRAAGEREYQRLPMQPSSAADAFRAALPAALQGRECEYFLEAFDDDGNGPFRKGTPERPLRLSLSQAVERAPKPTAPPPAVAKSAGHPRRTAGIVLVAGGAAVIVGGAISGLMALSDFGVEKSTADLTVYDRARSAAQTESVAADALYGIGAAAAVVGAILWLTDRSAPVTVSAAPTRGVACAVLSGRF